MKSPRREGRGPEFFEIERLLGGCFSAPPSPVRPVERETTSSSTFLIGDWRRIESNRIEIEIGD